MRETDEREGETEGVMEGKEVFGSEEESKRSRLRLCPRSSFSFSFGFQTLEIPKMNADNK